MIITIDGPSASGKSSLARAIAKELNLFYLNSGLLFRAVAYVKLNYKIDDIKMILSNLTYCFDGINETINYNGENITKFLKTPEIDNAASQLSTNQDIRNALLHFQYELAKENSLVTDGRDCGSVIFPNADVKIYLTASLKVRAMRWQHDMQSKGKQFSLQEAQEKISERDQRDKNRIISALKIPKDAVVIDNSDLSQKETFEKVLEIIKAKLLI